MKKSTLSKVAMGSACALLAIVMTGCASANQDAAIKNLSSQLDRVTNTVGQISTADIQSLNPTDYYANTSRYFNNDATMQNTMNGRNHGQFTSFENGRQYFNHGLAYGGASTNNTPTVNNNQPTHNYQTQNGIQNDRQSYSNNSQTNCQTCYPTLTHIDSDNPTNRLSTSNNTNGYNANQNETDSRNYYRYQYQNPALPSTYQTGNANTPFTKNQRLSTAMTKTMNCAYEQDFMKENLINQCTMIKNDIHQNLKLSSNQVKALNGLTNSISRYATNLNNNKTDVANSIKMIRKNSNKKDYSQLDQVNAYYQALNNHLDARLCYFQNLMNTMDEVQSLLDEAKFGTHENTQPQNLSDTNTIRTTEKTTPSRNIYNGRQPYHYSDQPLEQSNVNNNPQTVQEETKKNMKNIDTMTSSQNNTANNANTMNTNKQKDTQFNNSQHGVYYNDAYGSNGPNGNYYNSNEMNGNRNNQSFNPNRNTDTYGPGFTNIDTYKTNPAGTYNNGYYNGVNYGNDLQVQPENVKNERNVNHRVNPTKPVTNVTQQNQPSTLVPSDKKATQEKSNENMNNYAKETEDVTFSTDNEKTTLPTKTMEQPRTVIRQNTKKQDDCKTMHGKIVNGPSTQQPQVSDTQTRTQEVKKVHPAGVRPSSANH